MNKRDETRRQVGVMVERPKHGGWWVSEAEGRWRHRLRGDLIQIGEDGEIIWWPPDSDPAKCELFSRAELKGVLDVIAEAHGRVGSEDNLTRTSDATRSSPLRDVLC